MKAALHWPRKLERAAWRSDRPAQAREIRPMNWRSDLPKTVVSYGEALWDLLPAGPVLGGAPCNLACRIQQMGDRAALISRVGSDELGAQALDQIAALGLDTRYMQVDDERPTGTVDVSFDQDGQPDYVINPDVAYDYIEHSASLTELAREADCICYGTLAQRADPSRQTLVNLLNDAAENGKAKKFLDINLRKNCYFIETVSWSLAQADVLKLNEEEALELAEMFGVAAHANLLEIVKRLVEKWSLEHCLVTLGERGALCASLDGAIVYEPGFKVDLIDPCGSGDAFSAGFLRLLLRDKPMDECCRLGNALGAIVASQHGATAPIENAAVEQLLSGAAPTISDPALADAIS